ncbi:RNA polymerase sigma factor [Phenylobacterium sp.]|uniref:RNA polymerase sigma factor n=1 Tax=Phenylobacterium sp. TaxID=1871053 RepID=UPI0035B3B448
MRPSAEQELEALDRRFRPALMGFFLRRLRNHADAEDLTQEVFIRLARTGAHIEQPQAFVFQVAANLLRDRLRHDHVRREHRQGLGALEARRVEWLDPARVHAAREDLQILTRGLAELPERTRNIFLLYRLEKMTRIEIAAELGVSVSAVEKHLARAMAHLTLKLEGRP